MPHLNLQALKLRDYRCFEVLDIDFHPQLTVLVAANGAGKTSVLDAIAVAFGPYVGAFDEAVGKHFESSDIRLFKVRETASHEMEYAPNGVRLEAYGFIPDSLIDSVSENHRSSIWRRALTGPTKAKTTIKDAKELIDYGKRLQEAVRTPGKVVLLPLLAYYGTGRLWQQKKLMASKKIQRTSRTIGYADCLDPASSYKAFVEWFRYWNLNAKETRIKAQETGQRSTHTEFEGYIQSVSGAVNACLAPAGWKDIEYSFTEDALVAHHDQFGQLPVELLSDGIRNMIGMVADIAFRATKLNGHLGSEAAIRTPGIVLIDEVDMHLHPEWQQVVLLNLTRAFPALQFIVTTHSPQVLSTVRRENIRVLSPDQSGNIIATEPMARTYGEPSGDVMQSVMLVDPQPPVAEKADLQRLTELVDQGRYQDDTAISLMSALTQTLGEQHPQLQRLRRSIQRQEALKR
ncbi:AAA family ATPase [Thauera sp.]|uniref:AAA family ATPase n=1 Tax=Thauera sp. TaxID=1905334 RepID=UPI002B86A90C|nr:AAA family ATPase [Thauera sp.]HRP25526.1 AAA family ATPase [Thauera sp.]